MFSSHPADRHDVIRVRGARVNNLKNISVDLPKRRLTVFTGVSGSGKSSLVFGVVAAESQRLINETYSAFVQGFMPSLARPDVDALDGLTTAILVDQERMGANARSTVGTATDANAMLRVLYSRLDEPRIGPPNAYSFNVPSVRGAGSLTVEKAGGRTTEVKSFEVNGGMCPRCEGMGSVKDIDLTQLFDADKSLAQGALTIPGYTLDGWYVRIFTESGFLDPNKPIRDYTAQERQDFLYKDAVKVKIGNINLTYEGLIPKIQKSFLSKDLDAMQPHIRAFVERAVTFSPCPDCGGTRLNAAARSSRIKGFNIAEACAMQISDLAAWLRGVDDPTVAPLVASLRHTLDSFVEIGLGYLSLDRPTGTLSGGESQRTRMVRHLGSALTDVTYVFDEPTVGLHPHDIQRMNELLLRLRDKGNTVLVVEHKPEVIAIADHVVDIGPRAGTAGGEVVFEAWSPAWEWINLPYAGGIEGGESCRVGGANLLGVVASPWSADAYIWGKYTQSYGADTLAPVERGGVCRVPLAAPLIRSVLSPVGSTRFDLSVVDVQPNPSVAGELLLATSTADAECHKLYRNQLVWNLAHPGDELEVRNECPRNAPAVIAQQSFTTLGVESWDAAVVEGTPSALVGSDSAWLPHLRGVGLPTFYYAGTSGGIWEATVSW